MINHEKHEMHEKILYKEEVFALQGAAFEVYREMGCGYLEAVYQECLEKEFSVCGIPFIAQPKLELVYKNEKLRQHYQPDFICFDNIIIEIKAVKACAPEHKAQLLNYLHATKKKLGLLVNFGAYPKTEIIRMVL